MLFRGQPKQTEEEDGRNQKADAEYEIREGFVKNDLIECVIVLPSKLFYGNNVPGCLIVLNKRKAPESAGKILMIWASRDFQKGNPQNILRPSDLMRILVPWAAFGDLQKARDLVPVHEARLVAEEEAERDRRMQDIEDAYAPLLEPLPGLVREFARLEPSNYSAWRDTPDRDHPFFGELVGIDNKAKLRTATAEAKKGHAARLKQLKGDIKELRKIRAERDEREKEIKDHFDREINHIREVAADLLGVCSNTREAARYFAVVEAPAIEENEFNLNLPRYVDTFETEENVPLDEAIRALNEARVAADSELRRLDVLLLATGAVVK